MYEFVPGTHLVGRALNRAFSAGGLAWIIYLGRCPRLSMIAAPLALRTPQLFAPEL
jgi:hypothetical protein